MEPDKTYFSQNRPALVAHVRESDKTIQTLSDHLLGVARLAEQRADKIGLGRYGRLLGLLHDIGKASAAFQRYICSAAGIDEQDADLHVAGPAMKGKIDHSTAGAQLLHEFVEKDHRALHVHSELLSLCLVSHHSGLINCLDPNGRDRLLTRILKNPVQTSFIEIKEKIPAEIMRQILTTFGDETIEIELPRLLHEIGKKVDPTTPPEGLNDICQFRLGMIAKYLFRQPFSPPR